MKALIFDGEVRLDTKHPVPERKPFEALIRVLKAGICRTDLEIIKGYLDFTNFSTGFDCPLAAHRFYKRDGCIMIQAFYLDSGDY